MQMIDLIGVDVTLVRVCATRCFTVKTCDASTKPTDRIHGREKNPKSLEIARTLKSLRTYYKNVIYHVYHGGNLCIVHRIIPVQKNIPTEASNIDDTKFDDIETALRRTTLALHPSRIVVSL